MSSCGHVWRHLPAEAHREETPESGSICRVRNALVVLWNAVPVGLLGYTVGYIGLLEVLGIAVPPA